MGMGMGMGMGMNEERPHSKHKDLKGNSGGNSTRGTYFSERKKCRLHHLIFHTVTYICTQNSMHAENESIYVHTYGVSLE
jgi:membrane protease subunit (stomatin/prohibitin family)